MLQSAQKQVAAVAVAATGNAETRGKHLMVVVDVDSDVVQLAVNGRPVASSRAYVFALPEVASHNPSTCDLQSRVQYQFCSTHLPRSALTETRTCTYCTSSSRNPHRSQHWAGNQA